MCCNITIRLHVAFWFDWSKFCLRAVYRKLYMRVAPLPVVVGFLYLPEANQTGLRKPVHHAQREIKIQY